MDEITKYMPELVEFIKGVSPDVWATLIKQQAITGWSLLAGFGLAATFGLVGLFIFKATDDEGWAMMTVATGLVSVTLFIFVIVEGVPRLLNPEYYALMALLPGK